MDISFRLVTPADKPRILEIAAQVWEGEDYVPDVIDDWLAPTSAVLIAACVGDTPVAFGRYDQLLPDYVWLEGLRTDPAWQGRGIAKALTAHMLARARADGAQRVGLSTYLDNLASQRTVEAHGFHRAAGFVYLEARADAPARGQAQLSARVAEVSPGEAAAFIAGSAALALGRGFLPQGWRFHPFARSPAQALAAIAHLLGVRRAGQLAALLCLARPVHGPHVASISFLEGEPAAMAELARHALHLAAAARYVEAMIPRQGEIAAPALAVLQALGFAVWNDGREDVFVYERVLPQVSEHA